MTQRIRNIFTGLNVAYSANEIMADTQVYGLNMSAVKAADQSVASSTTFVNDDTLWVELIEGRHIIYMTLTTTINATPGLKYQFIADQGLEINAISIVGMFGINAAASQQDITTALSQTKNTTGTAYTILLFQGAIDVKSKGVLQLQWAQQVSNATATVVKALSSIETIQATP